MHESIREKGRKGNGREGGRGCKASRACKDKRAKMSKLKGLKALGVKRMRHGVKASGLRQSVKAFGRVRA